MVLNLFWRLFDRLSKSFLSQMTLIVISSFDCSVSKDTKLSGTWWLLTRLKYGWRSRAIDRIWFYWISASTCPDILFIHRVSIHLNGSLSHTLQISSALPTLAPTTTRCVSQLWKFILYTELPAPLVSRLLHARLRTHCCSLGSQGHCLRSMFRVVQLFPHELVFLFRYVWCS